MVRAFDGTPLGATRLLPGSSRPSSVGDALLIRLSTAEGVLAVRRDLRCPIPGITRIRGIPHQRGPRNCSTCDLKELWGGTIEA